MEKTTVQLLLRGSNNVDRMETEIKEVISMVLGFARKFADAPPITNCFTFDCNGGQWEVSFEKWSKDPNKRETMVKFFVKNDGDKFLVYSHSILTIYWQNLFLKTHIQKIHSNLDSFVRGIMTIFPGIEKDWQYLIKASAVF